MSLLKRYQDTKGIAEMKPVELSPFIDEGVFILELQTVLDYHWAKQGTYLVEESLMQWKHLPIEEATWEPTQKLREIFSNMDLVDKDAFGEEVLLGHDVLKGTV